MDVLAVNVWNTYRNLQIPNHKAPQQASSIRLFSIWKDDWISPKLYEGREEYKEAFPMECDRMFSTSVSEPSGGGHVNVEFLNMGI